MKILPLLGVGVVGLLAACAPLTSPEVARILERDGTIVTRGEGPEDARPNACYARDVTPAVIETVTEQIIVQPAQVLDDGTVLSPAIYRTESQQRIVRERRETWFETPCAEVWTAEFTGSLQRALQVRGLFYGPITGLSDARTRAAIRRFQKAGGLDSAILSLESARRLGLVAVPRDS